MAGKAVALGPGIPSIEAQEKRDRVPGGLYGPGWSSVQKSNTARDDVAAALTLAAGAFARYPAGEAVATGPTTGLLGESRIASAINSIAGCC